MITREKDQFGAWMEKVPGVYGAGDTAEEAKENLIEGLQLFMEANNDHLPEELRTPFDLVFHSDPDQDGSF